MKKSRVWENGQPSVARSEVERQSRLQRKKNVMTKKSAIAVVALVTGALILPNQEALARTGGGFEAGHGAGKNGFPGHALEGDFHGRGFGVGGNRGAGFGGRTSRHFAVRPGELEDPYWSPCNYNSYGTDSCGA
jgi:hypothetical protein